MLQERPQSRDFSQLPADSKHSQVTLTENKLEKNN